MALMNLSRRPERRLRVRYERTHTPRTAAAVGGDLADVRHVESVLRTRLWLDGVDLRAWR